MKNFSTVYLLAPILVFACLETMLVYPGQFAWLAAAVNLVVLTALAILLKFRDLKANLRHFLLPLLFVNSCAVFCLILSFQPMIHFLYGLSAVFLFSLLKRLSVLFAGDSTEELILSLDSIKLYSSLAAVYFLSASFFGILIVLNYSILPLLVVLGIFVFAAAWIGLAVFGVDLDRALPYALIITFLFLEMAWAVTLLPFNYAVSGLLLAVFYYVATGLTRNMLLEKLSSQSVKIYLGVGLACVICILLTARWI